MRQRQAAAASSEQDCCVRRMPARGGRDTGATQVQPKAADQERGPGASAHGRVSRFRRPSRRHVRLLGGPIALLFLAMAPLRAADEVAAIEAAAQEWIVAFKAGDINALMQLYMPDAVVALHGQPALRGSDAIRAYFAPKMGTADVEFLLDVEEIEVHGDTAHLVSKYWYTGTPKGGGEPYRDAGRSALIYKRDGDGRWKIYLDIDQATPDVSFPPPAPGTPAAPP